MTVGSVQVAITVTAGLCVGKTGLEGTLLIQVVGSGLARSGLVVIFLPEGMDSQMMRQRMPKQHPMLVSGHANYARPLPNALLNIGKEKKRFDRNIRDPC